MSDTTTLDISHKQAVTMSCGFINASKQMREIKERQIAGKYEEGDIAGILASAQHIFGYVDANLALMHDALPQEVKDMITSASELPKP